MGFPSGSTVKNLAAVQELQGTRVRSLGWEDPQKRAWQPTPVLLGEPHGQRSLAGHSSCGYRVTENRTQLKQLSTHREHMDP